VAHLVAVVLLPCQQDDHSADEHEHNRLPPPLLRCVNLPATAQSGVLSAPCGAALALPQLT
jgi:hypothetical protein